MFSDVFILTFRFGKLAGGNQILLTVGYCNQNRLIKPVKGFQKMKYDWFNISDQDRTEWERLCPLNHYRVLPPTGLLGPIPSGLTGKYDSVVIAASGTTDGMAFFMINGNRFDRKYGEIDQMPFGIGFIGASGVGSGVLIQHGDWEYRTTPIPSGFYDRVAASGLGTAYPLSTFPPSDYGRLDELFCGATGQYDAFRTIVKAIQKEVEQPED